jgi:hypothetical protein
MSVTTVSSSMITDATILNADIGASAAIAQSKLAALASANMPAGSVVQVVNSSSSAVATGTTVVLVDDSIPQKTEGDEYMTLAITPTHASNKLLIVFSAGSFSTTALGTFSVALFQDTTANAIAGTLTTIEQNYDRSIELFHYMAAGTTSATTFKIRAGNINSNTTTFNGRGGGRYLGGVMSSTLTIMEILV